MEELTNHDYSATADAFDNVCIAHWVVDDKFHGNSDSPIGWQQAKNMRDHVIMEFAMKTNGTVSQVVDKDLDKLIQKVQHTNKRYAIVLRDHTIKIGQLVPELANFMLNDLKDEVIVGHLLDWKSEYYEIHHQSFLLDMQWYVNAGKPSFKTGFGKGPWQATAIDRSVENFHDPKIDHTPIWMKSSGKTKTFNGYRHGALVIAKAMQDGRNIRAWTENVRNAKTYLYPELVDEHYRHYQHYLVSVENNNYFANNTETIFKESSGSDYDIMFVPASGIYSLVSPYLNKLNPAGELISYDVSPISLRFVRYLDRWEGPGTNIADYITRFIDYYSEFSAVSDAKQLDKIDNWINNTLGKDYDNWWRFTRPHISKDLELVNLMYFKDYKRLVGDRINNFRQKHSDVEQIKIFVNLSNIFHYPLSSMTYSLRYRTQVLNQILEYNSTLENVEVDVYVLKPLLDKYSKFEELPPQLQKLLSYKDH